MMYTEIFPAKSYKAFGIWHLAFGMTTINVQTPESKKPVALATGF
ncbi:hypothetical protein [Colwellia sp. C1TZA3]|nr:hypothetical protein [Colwellia sp. C1TZA3]